MAAKLNWGAAIRVTVAATITIGTIVMFPIWNHHDIRRESPVFATEAEAQGWVRTLEAGEAAACIDWSKDAEVIEQAYGSGWFVEYRCNTPRSWGRVAIGFAIPAIVALLLAIAVQRGRRRD